MSILSEIERLNSIKERIRTNLVAQGITVPEDAVLADMAEQILSVAGISATHSWEGTTLTITSASGSSSVDLKGEKGDSYDPEVAIARITLTDESASKEFVLYVENGSLLLKTKVGEGEEAEIVTFVKTEDLHEITVAEFDELWNNVFKEE